MSIDIGIEALEGIVKDGIKEMLQLGGDGGVRARAKASWYKAVKEAVLDYQRRLLDDFLPVLVRDFSTSAVVKFSRGKMSEEDIKNLKSFMEMVEKSNFGILESELLKKIEDIKNKAWRNQTNDEKMEKIKQAVVDGHQWIFRRLELHVRSKVKEEMYKRSVKRSSIEVMLFNFTDGKADGSLRNLFQHGMDSVPSSRISKKEADRRVLDALLEYVMRLGRRKIYGYSIVQASSVQDWIIKMKNRSMDKDARDFVDTLEATLPALQAELDLVFQDVEADSKEEMIKKLDEEGKVLVICDKNMGMSLFSLETMRKADEGLMSQLGAIKMNNTKEEIIALVVEEIDKFEKGLTRDQKEFMDTYYGSRLRHIKKTTFPFLKSQHKIHKMTEDQIKNKDLSVLKFRPVVDAKEWMTR